MKNLANSLFQLQDKEMISKSQTSFFLDSDVMDLDQKWPITPPAKDTIPFPRL